MPIDPNDEILQDFLVEAGELLEALNEQLIDLERDPDNRDLLNGVFRSFHTIKGGAGFLNLNPLVEVCHRAEDVFNLLRNGQRRIDPFLMDTILRVLDVVNVMFGDLKAARDPTPSPASLLRDLESLLTTAAAPAPVPDPAPAPTVPAVAEPVAEPMAASAAESADAADEISESEFDALLDALSGQQDEPAAVAPPARADSPPPAPPAVVEAATPPAGGLISDDEFEALLDQLQGVPKAQGAPSAPAGSGRQSPPPPPETKPASKPASKPETKQASKPAAKTAKVAKGAAKPEPKPEPAVAAAVPQSPAATPPPAASPPVQSPAPPAASAPSEGARQESIDEAMRSTARQAVAPAETSVRVDTQRLDEIMNLVGELVLVRNRLSMLRARTADDDVAKAISSLALVTADLQAAVMKTRMQPIKKVFSRFPRVVRDLARALGKEIELETFGEETALDKNLVEALADPLVHLVRNAVDHGIESPEKRAARGKPRQGKVTLGAAQEGDHISLIITDDGAGMDPQVLRTKAVEKGLIDVHMAERMSDRDAFNLIFMAGLSTKEQITDVSGRGVGMDVVKTRIAQLNGNIEISSEPGKGTVLQVKLPLTLAILPALMVILGGRRFAIPLSSVSEILELDLNDSHFVDDQEVIMVRGHALPLYHIGRWLRPKQAPPRQDTPYVIVVQVAQRKVGLVVDGLVGQEDVVIKPLGLGLYGVPGLAGATITGDGGIALILDVPALLRVFISSGYGGRAWRALEQGVGV